jgi:hypothetical protein
MMPKCPTLTECSRHNNISMPCRLCASELEAIVADRRKAQRRATSDKYDSQRKKFQVDVTACHSTVMSMSSLPVSVGIGHTAAPRCSLHNMVCVTVACSTFFTTAMGQMVKSQAPHGPSHWTATSLRKVARTTRFGSFSGWPAICLGLSTSARLSSW